MAGGKLKKETPITTHPVHYQVAYNEIGQKEIYGSKHNKKILEYHQATTLKATSDEVAWCSSFVSWCLEMAGIKSTRSAAARSYLNFGKKVSLADAKIGDIVVFQRGSSSWQGHVGFYAGKQGSQILVLGGNQSNSVNITPYSTAKLLGVRRV